MKHSFLILSFLLLAMGSMAQELVVHAPGQVEAGRRFEVRYEVNARGREFNGPTFKGFSVLTGPNTSSSSSMRVINGQVSSSTTTGFNYIIQADQEGTFAVGSASVVVDGKRITCPGFTIKVVKGAPQSQQPSSSGQGRSQASQQPQAQEINATTLFARASINKSNPYQGEQIIVSYKIYTQVPISQYQIDKLPGNKGFWAEDLTEGKQVSQYEETIDGRRYQVAEIRRGALYAQESGKLTIQPLDLDVLAMVQRQRRRTGTIWDLFDDPFFNSAQAVEKHLRTNGLTVNVKNLPSAPAGFNGAVGSFDIKGGVDTREVRANEALTYRLTISGSGNLMLVNAPELEFPKVFEVYDPQVSDKLNRSNSGVSGSRTFEWVLIPRSQGNYEIPAFSFVFFDPNTGHYVTKQIEAVPVRVNKGDPSAMKSVTSSKSDVKLLNSDINYINISKPRLVARGEEDHAEWWFWMLLCLIVCGTVVAVLAGRRYAARQEDVAGMRLRRAVREARKRLKKAAAHLHDGNDAAFYEEIYRAIWGCLADKYNIELSRLSSDTVLQCLQDKQVDEAQQEKILKTLRDVDFARFAPGDATAKKQGIYDEALDMIASI